ncbi:hypothetical protein QYF61_027966 [Mycteria americana]|uniref:Uncharacterized protein n=1 Tax=Mycteria americana TaxID=33587 RepID=A0AAN7NU05_MYCAM|nr:hypothetical protein QYF61_027966 [Mycteria americana]
MSLQFRDRDVVWDSVKYFAQVQERCSSILDHFHGPPLDPLQQLHVLLVLRAPDLDAVLQVGSHQSRAEGQNHLPRPAGHASFDAAQDTVGLLGCKHTLSAHVQLFIHHYSQVLFRRAALNHIIPQRVLKLRIAPTQVQDPALGLVEPHEVHIGPLLQLVQVPLDDILSFWHVNCTTQLGVICKLAEGALNLAVNDPQVLLLSTALNLFIPQQVLIPGTAPTQVQDLALDLVDLHEVHMGPLLKPVKLLSSWSDSV